MAKGHWKVFSDISVVGATPCVKYKDYKVSIVNSSFCVIEDCGNWTKIPSVVLIMLTCMRTMALLKSVLFYVIKVDANHLVIEAKYHTYVSFWERKSYFFSAVMLANRVWLMYIRISAAK